MTQTIAVEVTMKKCQYEKDVIPQTGALWQLVSEVWYPNSPQTGHLSSAVISATVRDVSKSANVPVSVHYTLSAPGVVSMNIHGLKPPALLSPGTRRS